jgi:hypothetical protein
MLRRTVSTNMWYSMLTNVTNARNVFGPRFIAWLIAGMIGMTLAGCSSFEWTKEMKWPWEPDPKPPERLADMWTYTVLRQPGQPGVRGFGGRLMFFDLDEKPIKVEGSVVVYAFDAKAEDPMSSRPERKFVISAENLEKHYSESKLGHSYSVWIPWDEVGGEERELVLYTHLELKNGKTVYGAASRQILSGEKKKGEKDEKASVARNEKHSIDSEPGMVRAASYQESVAKDVADGDAKGDEKRGVTTSTIDISPSFVRHSLQSWNSSEKQDQIKTQDVDSSSAKEDASPETIEKATDKTTSSEESAGMTKSRESSKSSSKLDRKTTGKSADSDSSSDSESSGRFEPQRFPARRGSVVAPNSDPIRRQPYRGQWPSALSPTPRSDRWHEIHDTTANDPATSEATSQTTEASTKN